MAPTPPPDKVHCPNCGKAYRWKPDLAGRKVQCQCSQKFRFPPTSDDLPEPIGPPAVPEQEPTTYEVDLDDEPKAAPPPKPAAPQLDGAAAAKGSGGKCPSCGAKIKPEAVICLNCGLNLREGTKLQTAVISTPADDPGHAPTAAAPGILAASPALGGTLAGALAASRASATDRNAEMAEEAEREHHFNEVTLPLILIPVGLVVSVLATFCHAFLPDMEIGFGIAYVIGAGILLAIQLPLLFVSIFLVAAIFKTSFGSLGTATLKLVATILCTSATFYLVKLLILVMTGGISVMHVEKYMALGVAYITFHVLCVRLFESDRAEVMALFLILIFGPILAMMLLWATIASLFV